VAACLHQLARTVNRVDQEQPDACSNALIEVLIKKQSKTNTSRHTRTSTSNLIGFHLNAVEQECLEVFGRGQPEQAFNQNLPIQAA